MLRSQHTGEIRVAWKLATFVGLAAVALVVGAVAAAVIAKLVPFVKPVQIFAPITALLILMGSWISLRYLDRRPTAAIGFGLDRPWLMHLTIGAVAGVGLVGVSWVVFQLAGFATIHVGEVLSEQWTSLVVGAIFCTGVAAQEELLFRGYAFQILARWNLRFAVMVSGLLFVAIHLPNTGGTSALVMLNLFLAHLLFVACYLRTRSLWLPIGLHAAWNFSQGFIFGQPLSGVPQESTVLVATLRESVWTGFEFGPEGGLIVTVVFAVSAAVAWRFVKQRHPAPDLLVAERAGAISPARSEAVEDLLPALPSRRIAAIDVLRGAAIIGILPMNMQLFGMIDGAFLNPFGGQWTDSTNVAVWVLLHIFIGHKDLTVFAMLFGAGIVMIVTRCRSTGQSAPKLHVRRMAILALLGLAHAYLVFSGDILFTYAVCGLVVYLFHRLRPAVLIPLGCLAYAVPMLLLYAAHVAVPNMPEENSTAIYAMFQPTPEMIAEYNATYAGSWLEQMPDRAASAFGQQTVLVVLGLGWIAGGMMLAGIGLYKLGVFTGELRDRVYWGMIAAGAFVGLPLILFGLWRNFAEQWRPEYSFLGGRLPSECAAPIMAVGWIGIVMLVCKHGRLGWLTGPVSAVGRMALTNYLAQSIICSLLFHGHGLGLVGRVDRVGQLMITVTIWVIQMIASTWWLRRYRFGPVEWLWRTLGYGRRPSVQTPGPAQVPTVAT